MSAGLDASTLTPGITAPEPSFTTPAMATCACAGAGSKKAAPHTITAQSTTRRMDSSWDADRSVGRNAPTIPAWSAGDNWKQRGWVGLVGRVGPVRPARSKLSDPEALLQLADAVACHRQFRSFLVFHTDEHTVHARVQLLDEGKIGNGGAVNTHEAARIEPRLEIGQRQVDHVVAAARCGKRQLVLREKVRHARDVEDRRPLADAEGEPFEAWHRAELRRQVAREGAHVGVRAPVPRTCTRRGAYAPYPFELVERTGQPVRFDRLEQIVERIDLEGIQRIPIEC